VLVSTLLLFWYRIQSTLWAVINRVNLKDEVFVKVTKYNRVDEISWLNQVPVACPKLVPPVDCLWSHAKGHHIRSWLEFWNVSISFFKAGVCAL
jgi:hypothetical protein